MKYFTKSFKETQKLGEKTAKEIIKKIAQDGAVILGLEGNLGGGKTTFLQGFAKGLGIKEKILSPTFVIMKRFKIKKKSFTNFYHIDCYRLDDVKDLEELNLKEILKEKNNIVAIEWSEKIKDILPPSIINISFNNIDKDDREITIRFIGEVI